MRKLLLLLILSAPAFCHTAVAQDPERMPEIVLPEPKPVKLEKEFSGVFVDKADVSYVVYGTLENRKREKRYQFDRWYRNRCPLSGIPVLKKARVKKNNASHTATAEYVFHIRETGKKYELVLNFDTITYAGY